MKESFSFTVPGNPIGKALKTQHVGKFARMRNSTPTANYMNSVMYAFKASVGDGAWSMLNCPLEVTIRAVFARPQYLLKRSSRTGVLLHAIEGRMPYAKKPDVDNISKAVLDALTQAGAWRDDSLVVAEHLFKEYAAVNEAPHLEVTIEWGT